MGRSDSRAAWRAGEAAWPSRARLHFVTGKGGTGKSCVSAALALALAAGGRQVLLVEVEGRQSIAQLFDLPPQPPHEVKIAAADAGGRVFGLAIDTEQAFLEYLEMFYNLGIAGRAMKRMGAVEFVTTLAPGLRDVILTGKIKECAIRTGPTGAPVYDSIVIDAPPTGRIASFLDVTTAVNDVARTGPIASQAEGVMRLLHSDDTVVHLVTLLEALPVQETADAVAQLTAAEFRIGSVIVNRVNTDFLPEYRRADVAAGVIDSSTIGDALESAGLRVGDAELKGLIGETIEYAATLVAQRECAIELDKVEAARLELPTLAGGIDLGGLYELAAVLHDQGVHG